MAQAFRLISSWFTCIVSGDMLSRGEAARASIGRIGGVRQRASASAGLATGNAPKSKLANLLLQIWVWGLISSTLLQSIADAAVTDIETMGRIVHPMLRDIQGIGTDGQYAGSCRRDLLRKFKNKLFTISALTVRVPCVPTTGNQRIVSWVNAPILMVNELFDYLYTKVNAKFNDMLGGGIADFWSKVQRIRTRGVPVSFAILYIQI